MCRSKTLARNQMASALAQPGMQLLIHAARNKHSTAICHKRLSICFGTASATHDAPYLHFADDIVVDALCYVFPQSGVIFDKQRDTS